MPSQIDYDESEPQEIVRMVSMALETEPRELNIHGWADYYYTGVKCYCHGSHEYNTERKTWRDLLSLEDVETQLQRQMTLHPGVHHRLIIEGAIEPAAKGVLIYTKQQGKNAMFAGNIGERSSAFKGIYSWLRQIGKYWEIIPTSTMAGTAGALVALYAADQVEEEEHQTLRRMFKEYHYTPNAQAAIILGASGKVKIGPAKAEAIAKHFGTAWRAFKAPMEEWVKVPGIGKALATEYLRSIGRPDV